MSKWLKADGTLDLDALDQLESNVRAVTDSNKALDTVVKAAKLGVPMTICFKCNHSGKFFPSDFVKEWGKLYGHGLGPDPVSECLDSDYDTAPPKITEDTLDISSIMHPLRITRVQVDLMSVPQEEYDANKLILHIDDPRMARRAKILRANQLNNSKGKLRALEANWMAITGQVVIGRSAA